MGFLRALPLSYLRLRKGQVSILRPRANNAMKYLLCETIFAPSGNRNRGTSLEGKYVTTTPKVLWWPVEEFNPLDRSFFRTLWVEHRTNRSTVDRSTIWAMSGRVTGWNIYMVFLKEIICCYQPFFWIYKLYLYILCSRFPLNLGYKATPSMATATPSYWCSRQVYTLLPNTLLLIVPNYTLKPAWLIRTEHLTAMLVVSLTRV